MLKNLNHMQSFTGIFLVIVASEEMATYIIGIAIDNVHVYER